jgi:hypothetical protein
MLFFETGFGQINFPAKDKFVLAGCSLVARTRVEGMCSPPKAFVLKIRCLIFLSIKKCLGG